MGAAATGAAIAGLMLWKGRRMKNNVAAATVTEVTLMRGEERGIRVRRREGLGFCCDEGEDEALMEENLNGDDEGGVRREMKEMGLGNDGRW